MKLTINKMEALPIWICLLVTLSVLYVPEVCGLLTPPIPTTHGPVIGVTSTYEGATVHVYKGIPYATAPVGDLRFAPPQPPERWTAPFEATQSGSSCLADREYDAKLYTPPRQPPPMGEDCLHLTIATPDLSSTSRRAVMVYIHGGSLLVGSSSLYDKEALVIAGDIVHVHINYRLNVFGFLTTNEATAPGNMGLLDQVMALTWIRDNIANFGGDPDRVTLFGISAGGWSISAHAVSPLSRGLFSRAIMQSGSLYGFKQESRSQRAIKTQTLAREVGCPAEDEKLMLECLRRTDAKKLYDATLTSDYLPFGCATYGDDLLPLSVKDMYDTHQIHQGIELMIGVTSEEGAWAFMMREWDDGILSTAVQEGITLESDIYKFVMEEVIVKHIKPSSESLIPLIKTIVEHQYLDKPNDKISNLRATLDIYGDCIFKAPAIGTARRAAEAGHKVFVYNMDQAPAVVMTLPLPEYTQFDLVAAPELHYGSEHAFDGFYMFGHGIVKDVPMSSVDYLPKEDQTLSKSMVHAFTTFAKTGKGEYLLNNGMSFKWQKFSLEEEHYLAWRHPMTTSSTKNGLRSRQSDFWNALLPALLETSTNVYCTN